ncbi:MAG TPA: glycosyltransferase family 2 protein [Phycisphaerae bacterium]|nr:glycosyltransferase family 2 protein [Phycisphaerae bacterium]HNU45036.1 glycosyltransferase family 2 protein [Phycisphaerae bacterium]
MSEPRPMQVATRTDAEPGPAPTFCDLSVIIPIHNEEENVGPLLAELREVLDGTRLDYELLFIDDGSTDQSLERLRAAAAHCPRVVILELRRNFGQTAAIAAGFDYSRGRVIIPMDGDLQNDPRDIPALLAKLEGPPRCDIVSGWRKNRHDRWLTRKVPSSLANALIRKVTGVRIHDFGCTLKVYRREVLEGVSFFSELHRFLPALAVWHGAHITEMEVNHRPRTRGRTKYGLGRTVRVLLDLVTVKFLGTYMTKPLYFFGKLAMWTLILALVLLGVAIGQKYGHFGHPDGLNLNRNVLVPLAALLCSFAVQCVLFGIVAELLVRVYHESRGRPVYRLRHVHHHPGRRPPESSGAR